MALPMNPQSVLFPAAPGEAEPPAQGRVTQRRAVQAGYQSGKVEYEAARGALFDLGMDLAEARRYLLTE